jgi:classical protein kinase C/novel protein kinase C epsilon type
MEFIGGGDMMFHIQHRKFTEEQARFFAAEILLALEFLHRRNIVYRDLKLDNILITLDGHAKLADYGLCKPGMRVHDLTSTFCGTPEFMAPEIFQEKAYTRSVDWWAFGVMLFELLYRQAPFLGKTEIEIYRSINAGRIVFPAAASLESKDLIVRV